MFTLCDIINLKYCPLCGKKANFRYVIKVTSLYTEFKITCLSCFLNITGKTTLSDATHDLTDKKQEAKLFLNGLYGYGKTASIHGIGTAISSDAVQKNFYCTDRPRFVYADTDSIHVSSPANKMVLRRIKND